MHRAERGSVGEDLAVLRPAILPGIDFDLDKYYYPKH